jgi:hypothetical protein
MNELERLHNTKPDEKVRISLLCLRVCFSTKLTHYKVHCRVTMDEVHQLRLVLSGTARDSARKVSLCLFTFSPFFFKKKFLGLLIDTKVTWTGQSESRPSEFLCRTRRRV